jgi:uncharacterized protein (DUF58 family)
MHNLFWSVLILFLIATLLRLDWVYYLVYVVGGVWVISHWQVRRSFRALSVQREMLVHAFLGEKIDVRVRLTNHGWLPMPWMVLEDRVPLDLKETTDYRMALSVGPKARQDHHFVLNCKRRGYYEVGPLALTTGDLFGFAEATWQEHGPTYVTVYPEIVSLDRLGLPSRSPFGVLPSSRRLFEDPARMAGVRPYVSGDSQRRIHWKASAHEDTLLVKKFQPAIALNVAVVLDLNREAYPLSGFVGSSEWAIVVAASIASYVVGQRQPVGLICNGLDSVSGLPMRNIPSRQGQGALMGVLTALARCQLRETGQSLAEWLPSQINDLEWGTTLVVVTPKVDEDALWVLHHAYRRGSSVMALICAAQPDYDRLRARSQKLGVRMQRTIWESDLHRLV